jgi:predicted dehydrogenase
MLHRRAKPPILVVMSSPLRLGILGCANIARQFTRDVVGSPSIRIAAAASRDAEKARSFAEAFAIPAYHGSYEALLASAEIDAVYIPLPNAMHAAWAIRAAEAGKHVLCEKPLGMGVAETRAMFAAARKSGVMLLEAYPYWFQPQTAELLALLRSGAIGEVRSVQASFGFTLTNPETNIRSKPELGGGALYDAGCYPLSLIRLVMGDAPVKVLASSTWTEAGVDLSTMATLIYHGGRRAQMSCAMDGGGHRKAVIVGSQGTIETEFLNHTSESGDHPHGFLASRMSIRRGIPATIPFEDIASPTGSGFRFTAEAFARMVAERDIASMEFYAAASNDVAATLEEIAKSARSG